MLAIGIVSRGYECLPHTPIYQPLMPIPSVEFTISCSWHQDHPTTSPPLSNVSPLSQYFNTTPLVAGATI